MKRFLATFFSVFYLAASAGPSVQIHRCMQEILVSMHGAPDCGKCGTTKKDCCKDSVKLVKLQNHHASDTQNTDFGVPLTALPVQIFSLNDDVADVETAVSHGIHAPPELFRPSRIYLFENLRI